MIMPDRKPFLPLFLGEQNLLQPDSVTTATVDGESSAVCFKQTKSAHVPVPQRPPDTRSTGLPLGCRWRGYGTLAFKATIP
jgi:hypothetical protein